MKYGTLLCRVNLGQKILQKFGLRQKSKNLRENRRIRKKWNQKSSRMLLGETFRTTQGAAVVLVGAAGVITPMAVDHEEAAGEVGPTRMVATNFMTTRETTLVTFTLGAITAIGEEAAGVVEVVVETFITIMAQELKPPLYQLSHDLTTPLVVYRAFLGN